MQRRSFFKAAAGVLPLRCMSPMIGVLTVSFPTAARAQSVEPGVFRALSKSYKQLDALWEWIDWANESVPDLVEGRIPPSNPPGQCGLELSQRLVDFAKDTDAIDVALDLERPDYSTLPGDTMRKTRAIMSENFTTLLDGVTGMQEFFLLESDIGLKQVELTARRDALDVLKEWFARLSQVKLPGTYQAAVVCWFSMETTFAERFNRADGSLKNLSRRLANEISKHREALFAAIREHENFLTLEEAQLETEHSIQDRMAEDLEQAKAVLNDRRKELEALEAKKADIATRLEALEIDIENLTNSIRDGRLALQQMNSRLSQVNNDLSKPYDLCPNGYSFEDCTHEDEKNEWRRRQANLRNAQRSIRLSIAGTEKRVQENEALKARFESDLQQTRLGLEEVEKLIAAKTSEVEAAKENATGLSDALKKRMVETPVELLLNAVRIERANLSTIDLGE